MKERFEEFVEWYKARPIAVQVVAGVVVLAAAAMFIAVIFS